MSKDLRSRLRAALKLAMRQHDGLRVPVLRTVLAAIENAEAVPQREAEPGGLALEATPVGPGSTEVARRELSDDEVERLVAAQISERQHAAALYDRVRQHDRAGRLRQEADALAAVVELSSEHDSTP